MMLHEAAQFLRRNVCKLFAATFGIGILLTVIFYFVYANDPQEAIEEIQSFLSANEGLLASENSISFVNLAAHNIGASILYLLFGFFAPISVLIIVVLSKNVAAALVYSQFYNNVPLWRILFLGLLPHGIFELSGAFLSISIGLYVGTYWFRKKRIYSWKTLAKNTICAYTCFVLPLIFLAALIETYITPLLF